MARDRPRIKKILESGIPDDPGGIFPGNAPKTIAAYLARGFDNYLKKLGVDQADITLSSFKYRWAGRASFNETDYGWEFKPSIKEYLRQYGFTLEIHKKGGYVTIKRREAKRL